VGDHWTNHAAATAAGPHDGAGRSTGRGPRAAVRGVAVVTSERSLPATRFSDSL